MEIEITKPAPEQQELQSLAFRSLDVSQITFLTASQVQSFDTRQIQIAALSSGQVQGLLATQVSELQTEETIAVLVKENDELYAKLKAWEACADNLVDYAHDFVAHLSSWGKGYDRNDKQIKLAEDAIETYNRLKNKT